MLLDDLKQKIRMVYGVEFAGETGVELKEFLNNKAKAEIKKINEYYEYKFYDYNSFLVTLPYEAFKKVDLSIDDYYCEGKTSNFTDNDLISFIPYSGYSIYDIVEKFKDEKFKNYDIEILSLDTNLDDEYVLDGEIIIKDGKVLVNNIKIDFNAEDKMNFTCALFMLSLFVGRNSLMDKIF